MKKERKQKNIAPQKAISEGKDNRLPLLFAALAIAVITYITYTPSLSGSFTNWDDDTYVTANPVIQSPSIDWKAIFTQPVALNYHPVTMLTLVLNYKVAGNEPKAYHATNLLLHIMNSILLFLFFYFLSGRKIVTGALAGLLSGIHPMHVESVAWISERKDVLYVFFLLLSLLAYVRYRSGHKTVWLICCFLLFLLSCLSKAMAVVLPLLLILIDYFQQRKLTRLAWPMKQWPPTHFCSASSLAAMAACFTLLSSLSRSAFPPFILIRIQPICFLSHCFFMLLLWRWLPAAG